MIDANSPGDNTIVWTFDTAVSSVADPAGFNVDGEDGDAVLSIVGAQVTIEYPDAQSNGLPWTFSAATAGVVFSPPATISNATGTTS